MQKLVKLQKQEIITISWWQSIGYRHKGVEYITDGVCLLLKDIVDVDYQDCHLGTETKDEINRLIEIGLHGVDNKSQILKEILCDDEIYLTEVRDNDNVIILASEYNNLIDDIPCGEGFHAYIVPHQKKEDPIFLYRCRLDYGENGEAVYFYYFIGLIKPIIKKNTSTKKINPLLLLKKHIKRHSISTALCMALMFNGHSFASQVINPDGSLIDRIEVKTEMAHNKYTTCIVQNVLSNKKRVWCKEQLPYWESQALYSEGLELLPDPREVNKKD
jgi:hypothetical protein